MESKEQIFQSIQLVKDQLKMSYKIKDPVKRSKSVYKVTEWLDFLESRYDFMNYCETYGQD